jgi:predicted ArsR family transcriptional regulator
MVTPDLDGQIAGVASLAEPQRRNLYRYVVSQPEPVGKDEAARVFGLARSVVGFHLDRLVADGLLETEYRRLSGRSGPGAGRPAKLYRRARQDITVNLPARDYGLAAELLATAVDRAAGTAAPVDAALADAAGERGRRLGEDVRRRAGGRQPSRGALVDATLTVLDEQGYEPRRTGDDVVMANCPFHDLAQRHRTLVCGMNLDLIVGLASRLPEGTLTARLDPGEDRCCVRLNVG